MASPVACFQGSPCGRQGCIPSSRMFCCVCAASSVSGSSCVDTWLCALCPLSWAHTQSSGRSLYPLEEWHCCSLWMWARHHPPVATRWSPCNLSPVVGICGQRGLSRGPAVTALAPPTWQGVAVALSSGLGPRMSRWTDGLPQGRLGRVRGQEAVAPGETWAALWPERTAGVQPQAVLAEGRAGPRAGTGAGWGPPWPLSRSVTGFEEEMNRVGCSCQPAPG